ncbi:MAG: hypothetical protein WBJ75_10215 [Pseudohongiellaceae bacterium]
MQMAIITSATRPLPATVEWILWERAVPAIDASSLPARNIDENPDFIDSADLCEKPGYKLPRHPGICKAQGAAAVWVAKRF